MNKCKLFWSMKILMIIMLCNFTVTAQNITVTGTVKGSDDNIGLPGVNIVVKGTSIGTSTDIDGNFTLSIPDPNATLVFSFVGYVTQEIVLSGQSQVDVILEPEFRELEEIVVVGYGTTKKSDLTGSMASLKDDDFNSGVITSPEQLMQGRVAGVEILSNSGEPGAGATVRIRGANSIRSDNTPLYVIDGFPMDIQNTSPDASKGYGMDENSATNPLNFINPDDIASIDVLKDASASAIYGARGANGVVLITTKKGTSGEPKLSYSTYASFSEIAKTIDVLSAEEFIRFREDSLGTTELHFDANTNWQDEIFRRAFSQNHNLSLSGGNENGSYLASLSYLDQEGIIINSGMQRYTGRLNLNQKTLKDRLNIEINLTASQINEQRAPIGGTGGFEGDLILNALQANPTIPVYDDDGAYFQLLPTTRNPVMMTDLIDDDTKTNRILGNMAATLNIIENLNYKVNVGVDNSNAARRINRSGRFLHLETVGGIANINTKELSSQIIEHTLDYSKEFGVHRITALAGFSYQNFLIRSYNIEVTGFESDEIQYTNNLELATEPEDLATSEATRNELQSFFGRVNYNFNEKYLFTATFRRDGSTKFGVNNKYGNFPSFAFAWRASQEDFIQNLNVFSNLKFRVGWGITGNQEIGSKHSLFLLGPDPLAKGTMDGTTIIPGLVLKRTPSPDIQWEETEQLNLGVDFGFFQGRLSGTVDLFEKTTTNMLLETKSIDPAPTTNQMANINAQIINKGIEVGLTGFILETKNFGWEMNVNFSMIDNVVKNLPVERITTGRASGQGMTGATVQVITDDKPVGEFYGYVFLGFDERGTGLYKTEEGPTGRPVAVKEYLGSPLPDYTFSVNNTFRYKKFDLSFFINGVQGNLIYNNTANSIFNVPNIAQGRNTSKAAIQTSENPRNSLFFSDRYLEDGSFIRLSNATLGYNIPISNFDWVSNLRVYVTGTNLFVITDYSGYDPEVSTDAKKDEVISYGIDYTNYPKSRTLMAGLKVTF